MNRKLIQCVSVARNLFELPNSSKRHFTFILERNKIISVGWNDGFKTHPLAARYGHRYNGIHSELMAILHFKRPIADLQYYDFVNIRLKQNKSLGNSKPCRCCANMLKDFNVTHVMYSIDEGFVNV